MRSDLDQSRVGNEGRANIDLSLAYDPDDPFGPPPEEEGLNLTFRR